MYRSNEVGLYSETYSQRKTINNILYIFSLFVFLIVAQNSDFSSNRIIWWGSVALLGVSFLTAYRGKMFFDSYAIWIGVFTFISFASVLWAIIPDLVLSNIKSMIVQVVALLIIKSSVRNQKDIEFVLKLLLFACLINSVYLILTNISVLTQQTEEFGDRLGANENWNANSIGIMTSVSSIIALYFLKISPKKSVKFFYAAAIAFLIFVSLITGSRKAVVILMGGMAAYIFASSKGKRIRAVFLIALIIILLWYVVMEVPYFYSVIGWRIEAFLSQYTGEGELDNSASTRQVLIEAAIDAWRKSPVFGHGLDCFRYFGRLATGKDYYAHNNFVELLADLGIVGFVSYYAGYLYVLVKSWKNRANSLSLLFFIMICVMLVTEYACVTYADFLFGVIIVLMFSCAKLKN